MSKGTLTSINYKCEFCGKVFYNQWNLQQHIQTAKYCLRIRGESISIKHSCEYCGSGFNLKGPLTAHLKVCKLARNIKIETNDKTIEFEDRIAILESKLISQKKTNTKLCDKLRDKNTTITEKNKELATKIRQLELLNQQLELSNRQFSEKLKKKKIKIKEQNLRISKLEKETASGKGIKKGIEKGIVIGMTNAKPQVINNGTINKVVQQKLDMISINVIEPLTIDLVNKNLDKYDYNTFTKGAKGIANFIKDITILKLNDGTIEMSYACTDTSRGSFHRLVEDKSSACGRF
jgi:hypothetical protein